MSKLDRRLLPLYLATFFHWFQFWFAIEKAFMRSIGFDDAAIGMSLSIALFVGLAVEVPSGILSDRWSRKGTLQIGYLFLFLSSVVGYSSDSFLSFTIAISIFAVFYALLSGLPSSIIYDVLLEDGHDVELYGKYYGRYFIATGLGLATGSLGSALIVWVYDLRITFIFSLVPVVASFLIISRFREPKIHRKNQQSKIFVHVKQTFSEVIKQPALTYLMIAILSATVVARLIFDFMQVWWLALSVSVVWFGPLTAFIQMAEAVSGWLASRLKNMKLVGITFLLTALSLALMVKSAYVITIVLFVVLTSSVTVSIILSKRLNDELPSNVRAGSESVVSFIGNCFSIIALTVFGLLSDQYSVFTASLMITALGVLLAVSLFKEMLRV